MQQAVERAERAARDPANIARQAARTALDQGDMELAEEQIQATLALRPQDGESLGNLGLIRLRQGQHAQAQDLFSQAYAVTRQGRWKDLQATARFWGLLRQADRAVEQNELVTAASLAERALQTAMRFGCDVVPITVEVDPESTQRLCAQWQEWNPGFELKVLPRPHRSLVAPTVHFVKTEIDNGRDVTVLLSQVEPRRWRHRLLYNQRGPILEAALRARTSAIITSMSVRID